ncbi:MAG: hypothetical protein DRR19_18300 [Candidatus Parabeggiatoa sp. nov. 1]|nr:MAG: hypothetical protein DRR19_18300 [Gammaproteobacteria bacterium]
MLLDFFSDEPTDNFKHVGSFGIFASGGSFPIEYFLTTFSCAELSNLTFAREISPDKLNFELLMQRYIDEERVRLEMEPYLNPSLNTSSPNDKNERTVYFPPLLAAIVPVTGKVMEAYYTSESGKIVTVSTEGQKPVKHIIREWQDLFKLTYFPSEQPDAYPLQIKNDGKTTTVGVRCEPVQLEVSLADSEQTGVKLVIIDGQHRLFTLQQVYKKHPELLKNTRVPVCILFVPKATVAKNQAEAHVQVPTVSEIFRRLFLDINNKVQSISGHVSILLSDNTLSSLTCRQFCNYILEQRGREGLAVIEWNTKTKGASNQIIRPYSITSIGILGKALEECIAPRKRLMKYILQLDEVANALEPIFDGDDTPPNYQEIQWNKFSPNQKKILEQQVIKYLIPSLERLLFGNQAFAKAFDVFGHHLKKIKNLAKSEQPNASDAQQVVTQILDSIKDRKLSRAARVIFRDFEVAVKQDKEANVSPLIQYVLFQRALFEAWAQILDIARFEVPVPDHATQGFIQLLDLAFREQGTFFSFDQPYMQQTVFSGNKFIAKEETRKILTSLLIAHLANPSYAQQVINKMQLTETDANQLTVKFKNQGQTAISTVLDFFELAKKRHFLVNYRVNLSIESREREELIEAEDEQKRHRKEVKEGKRLKTEVSKRFDNLVDNFVKAEIELATERFQNKLYG